MFDNKMKSLGFNFLSWKMMDKNSTVFIGRYED